MSAWMDPETWYRQLPSFYGTAAAFITDEDGRVLLVKPTYRDHWSFPGGFIEASELPQEACAREVREELGIDVTVGNLLVLDWTRPAGECPRGIVHFTFDCGNLAGTSSIRLDRDELEASALLTPGEAESRLSDGLAVRIRLAFEARRTGAAIYLPDGRSPARQGLSGEPSDL